MGGGSKYFCSCQERGVENLYSKNAALKNREARDEKLN